MKKQQQNDKYTEHYDLWYHSVCDAVKDAMLLDGEGSAHVSEWFDGLKGMCRASSQMWLCRQILAQNTIRSLRIVAVELTVLLRDRCALFKGEDCSRINILITSLYKSRDGYSLSEFREVVYLAACTLFGIIPIGDRQRDTFGCPCRDCKFNNTWQNTKRRAPTNQILKDLGYE